MGIILCPAYIIYMDKSIHDDIRADAQRYLDSLVIISEYQHKIVVTYPDIIQLLSGEKVFRNVFYFRGKKNHRLGYKYPSFLLPAIDSVEIAGRIGGGLYIPHNFVVLNVHEAGKNLNVLLGVVGKKQKSEIPYDNAIIGNNGTLCANCTIVRPVTIGDDAVIGAGSVVTNDVEPGTVMIGIPAHKM